MAQINLDENYFEHKKTKRLVIKLGKHAESLPIKLWCWAAKYHPEDGILKDYEQEEIKNICGWDGNALEMINALEMVGFIEKIDEKTYQIHNWQEHEGHIIFFKERAKSNALKRWGGHKKEPEQMPTKEFEELWSKFPNKVGKKEAWQIFFETVKSPNDFIDISKSVINYINSERVKKGFVKDGAKWFLEWRDWVEYKDFKSYAQEKKELYEKMGLKPDE